MLIHQIWPTVKTGLSFCWLLCICNAQVFLRRKGEIFIEILSSATNYQTLECFSRLKSGHLACLRRRGFASWRTTSVVSSS